MSMLIDRGVAHELTLRIDAMDANESNAIKLAIQTGYRRNLESPLKFRATSIIRKERKKMIKNLDRINELARKEREEGLTKAEVVEQTVLREDYLREIRGQVLNTFSGLTVLDPLGNDVTPGKLRSEQEIDSREQ